MKKVILSLALSALIATPVSVLAWGSWTPPDNYSDVYLSQGQDYEGSSGSGWYSETETASYQWGSGHVATYGGGSGSFDQFEAQGFGYSSENDVYSQFSAGNGSIFTSGYVNDEGRPSYECAGSYGNQSTNSSIFAYNFGAYANSAFGNELSQYVSGHANGDDAGGNSLVSFTQVQEFGSFREVGDNGYSAQGGGSLTDVTIGGNVDNYGSYSGILDANQSGYMSTFQSGNEQSGRMSLGGELNFDSYGYGDTGVMVSAVMIQGMSYSQYIESPNGWSFQSGNGSTTIDVHIGE